MAVLLKDVALRANVAPGTASKVLNGCSGVIDISEETRARVTRVARDMGYTPNRAARALATGKTHVVAFCVAAINVFEARIAGIMQRTAAADGYELMLTSPNLHEQKGGGAQSPFPADGVIALDGSTYLVGPTLRRGEGIRMPYVSTGFYYEPDADHAGIDWNVGLQQAITHLLGTGRRRIAMGVTHPVTGETHSDSYRAAAAEFGLSPEYVLPLPEFHPDPCLAGRQSIIHHVRHNGCPDAVICTSDEFAMGVYRGLLDLGIRVPRDVAIVGSDNISHSQYSECPISTIAYPYEEMCRTAWEFLRNRMENPDVAQQRAVFDSFFVHRMSTEPAGVDPRVSGN